MEERVFIYFAWEIEEVWELTRAQRGPWNLGTYSSKFLINFHWG